MSEHPDPDHKIKEDSRSMALAELQEINRQHAVAEDSLETALRMAAVGNALDFADPLVNERLAQNGGPAIKGIIKEDLSREEFWKKEDLKALRAKLSGGPKKVVLVMDNAGEDVLDLILVKYLLKEGHQITLVA